MGHNDDYLAKYGIEFSQLDPQLQKILSPAEEMIAAWDEYHRKWESGLYCFAPEGRYARSGSVAFGVPALWRIPKAERPRCGARTRKGTPCQAPAVFGRGKCRLHGGLATGPKTKEGIARIAESNRRRAEARRAPARRAEQQQ